MRESPFVPQIWVQYILLVVCVAVYETARAMTTTPIVPPLTTACVMLAACNAVCTFSKTRNLQFQRMVDHTLVASVAACIFTPVATYVMSHNMIGMLAPSAIMNVFAARGAQQTTRTRDISQLWALYVLPSIGAYLSIHRPWGDALTLAVNDSPAKNIVVLCVITALFGLILPMLVLTMLMSHEERTHPHAA